MKVWFAMRDITIDRDFNIVLPKENLEEKINTEHEYIICDCDFDISEMENIFEVNKLLLKWKEKQVNITDIFILQKTMFWNELVEAIENESYTIVDTSEADEWAISGESMYGYLLHHNGYYMLPFEYNEDMEDYIDWEQLWVNATCEGWDEVRLDNETYLVHR